MNFILSIFIVFTGAVIFLQDFQKREVMFFLFPLLGVLGFFKSLLSVGVNEVLSNSFINLAIISFQLALLFIYFLALKKRTNIHDKIGIGDLLILSALCFFFSPVNFVMFHLCSLVLSLIFHCLFQKHRAYRDSKKSIALAGWQSFFLIIVIIHQPFS